MKKGNAYSWIALFLIVVGEIFAFCGIHWGWWCLWGLFTALVLVLLVILWVIGRKHNHRFSLSSVILTKLLANAIAPRTLGTIYLLLFVTHLGWLGNVSINLFMPSGNLTDVFIALGVCLIGVLALIVFFPSGEQKKTEHPVKVFISGISGIAFKQNLDMSNLNPIVRMLQLTDDENDRCELLILHSKYYSKEKESKNKEWIDKNYDLYFNAALECIGNNEIKNEYETKRKDAKNNITELLKLLIRMLAIVEFPHKRWLENPEYLQITFSEQCDYEEFGSCFTELVKNVKAKDCFENQLFFNLTPGSANVSALMTLMAIDGNRKLYYYKPLLPSETKDNEDEKSALLVEVNKADIPLQNLLSQALDSFEMENR